MRIIAQLISFIFHPLLLTTYLVIVLGYFFPPMLMLPKDKLWIFASVVFCLTFLLPSLNLLLFKQFKIINSLTMEGRKDRIVPFIFITILYIAITALFVYRIHISINFSRIMIVTAALVGITCFVTFFYKISVHSLSIWGGIGILLPLCRPAGQPIVNIVVFLIAIAGFVMASRLYLNAHTPRQILIGALVGFLVGFGGIIFLF